MRFFANLLYGVTLAWPDIFLPAVLQKSEMLGSEDSFLSNFPLIDFQYRFYLFYTKLHWYLHCQLY